MELTVACSDLTNICRLCLARDKPLVEIIYWSFPKIKIETTCQVIECSSIQIRKEEDLSNLICELCCTQLENILQFQQQALKSERILNQYLQQLRAVDKQSVSGSQKPALAAVDYNSLAFEMLVKEEEATEDPSFLCEVSEDICISGETDANDLRCQAVYNSSNEETHMKPLIGNYQLDKTCSTSVNHEFSQVYFKEEPEDDSSNEYTEDTFFINDNNDISIEETKINMGEPKISLDTTVNRFDLSPAPNITENSFLSLNDWESTQKKRLIYCDICNKCFTQLTFKKHKQRHINKTLFQCNACPKFFTYSDNLKKHSVTHTGEKLYQCDICSKSFTRSHTLKVHKRLHTGEKPHRCDVCYKSFAQLGSLNMHKLLHTGKKQFQCDICKKAFKQLGSLIYHKVSHTGEKRFKCDLCKKSFTSFYNLKIHKLVHTGEKPHQCNICYKKFTQLGNLKTHIKVRHK